MSELTAKEICDLLCPKHPDGECDNGDREICEFYLDVQNIVQHYETVIIPQRIKEALKAKRAETIINNLPWIPENPCRGCDGENTCDCDQADSCIYFREYTKVLSAQTKLLEYQLDYVREEYPSTKWVEQWLKSMLKKIWEVKK